MQTGGEWSRKPCQEFKPCMKLRGNVFDYAEVIWLRGREREREGLSLCPALTLGSLDLQSRQIRWNVAGRPRHGLWVYCCLCQIGWLLDQSRMIPGGAREMPLWAGRVWGCLSRWKTPGTVVAWAELWLSELSDIATLSFLRSSARWLGFEKTHGTILASKV